MKSKNKHLINVVAFRSNYMTKCVLFVVFRYELWEV